MSAYFKAFTLDADGKQIADVTDQVKNLNLSKIISGSVYLDQGGWTKVEIELTAACVDDFVYVLGKGCRHNTKVDLRGAAKYGFSGFKNYGIFERLQLDNIKGWDYCAGQDYTGEIAEVRRLLLK